MSTSFVFKIATEENEKKKRIVKHVNTWTCRCYYPVNNLSKLRPEGLSINYWKEGVKKGKIIFNPERFPLG